MIFFFNDTATTEIYTLSLHDALPISIAVIGDHDGRIVGWASAGPCNHVAAAEATWLQGPALAHPTRSEEHTSELQSHLNHIYRLLLEKKIQRHSYGYKEH